jgi:hypothetical protein
VGDVVVVRPRSQIVECRKCGNRWRSTGKGIFYRCRKCWEAAHPGKTWPGAAAMTRGKDGKLLRRGAPPPTPPAPPSPPPTPAKPGIFDRPIGPTLKDLLR